MITSLLVSDRDGIVGHRATLHSRFLLASAAWIAFAFRLLPRGGAAHRWPLAGLGLTAVRDDHGRGSAAMAHGIAGADEMVN